MQEAGKADCQQASSAPRPANGSQHSSRARRAGQPWPHLDVAVQVGDELVLLVRHTWGGEVKFGT